MKQFSEILLYGHIFRPPDEDTCGSGDVTEDDDDDDPPTEPGRIPDEAVLEQYMFMGNLYTLKHIRTDADKTEPKVDVVTVPQNCPVEATIEVNDEEMGHKLNGSAVPDETEKPGNGVVDAGGGEGGGGGGGGGDNRPTSKTSSKPSSRPASLILRSVFPTESVQE